MKKISTQQILLSLSMSVLGCISFSESQAQCRYGVVTLRNDTTYVTIPCDFPVKANTGDSTLDANRFYSALDQWNQTNLTAIGQTLLTPATTGIKTVFFEIRNPDFLLFTEERKTAILASPALYSIKP